MLELSEFSGHFYYKAVGQVIDVYELKTKITYVVKNYDPYTGKQSEYSYSTYGYEYRGRLQTGAAS